MPGYITSLLVCFWIRNSDLVLSLYNSIWCNGEPFKSNYQFLVYLITFETEPTQRVWYKSGTGTGTVVMQSGSFTSYTESWSQSRAPDTMLWISEYMKTWKNLTQVFAVLFYTIQKRHWDGVKIFPLICFIPFLSTFLFKKSFHSRYIHMLYQNFMIEFI